MSDCAHDSWSVGIKFALKLLAEYLSLCDGATVHNHQTWEFINATKHHKELAAAKADKFLRKILLDNNC